MKDKEKQSSVAKKSARATINLGNLPAEIRSLARFFPVALTADGKKLPKISGWQKPENQKLYSEIDGLAGFDTCGHGHGDDFALLDFDHVLNEAGEFVNEDAALWFNHIKGELGGEICFCEKSITGSGLHILIKPTPGNFKSISNGRDGVFHFGGDSKLEIFYGSAARYCLTTGNLFQCSDSAQIPQGSVADSILAEILTKIAALNKIDGEETPPAKSQQVRQSQDSPEYELFRARIMLEKINPPILEYSDWLAVISAAKNIGIDYGVVDDWNKQDSDRYDAAANFKHWDSLSDPKYNIATLHGIAKRFGYEEKSARAQWRKENPDDSTQGETQFVDSSNTIKHRPPRKIRPIPAEWKLSDAQIQKLAHGNNSDTANADRLCLLFGSKIRFVADLHTWLIWQKSGVWKDFGEKNDSVVPFVRDLAEIMTLHGQGSANPDIEKTDEEKRLHSAGYYLQDAKHVNPCIAMLKGDRNIRIIQEDLNRHKYLLNVKNGVIDLRTGEFTPGGKPELLITQQAPAEYRPGYHNPDVDKFWREVLPDEPTREAILLWFGYCLTGDVRHHKTLFMQGKGGNGKGTATRLIKRTCGVDYSCDVGAESFLVGKPKDPGSPNPDLYNLRDRRVAFVEELPRRQRLNQSVLNKLTGGDRITARALHQNFLAGGGFDPTHKLIFSGNYFPEAVDVTDKALLRRLLCVNFPVDFTQNPDETLDDKLSTPEALSGMLTILVKRAVKWYQNPKLIESPAMLKAKQKFIDDNNFVAEFVEEFCILGAGKSVKRKDFEDKLKHEYPQAAAFKKRELTELILTCLQGHNVTLTKDRKNFYWYQNIDLLSDLSGDPLGSDEYAPPMM